MSKTLKEKIYTTIVAQGGSVTFVYLARLEGFAGDYELAYAPNCVLWRGISEEAVTVLRELINEGRVRFRPVTAMLYFYDGTSLALPITDKPEPHDNPHWLPVAFWPGEEVET